MNEHVLINLGSAVDTVRPDIDLPSALSSLWEQSVHKDYRGEWDFRLDWKPIEGFPTKVGKV